MAAEATSRAEQLEEDLAGLRAQVAQVCVGGGGCHFSVISGKLWSLLLGDNRVVECPLEHLV